MMGLLCAEQNVENIKHCTFRNSGTPVRRTKRRNYKKLYIEKLWDSCAQNNTAEISTIGLSEIMGLLCAEQNIENLNNKDMFRNVGTPVRRTKRRKSQQMDVQKLWDSCAQNKTSEISTNVLSGILGLLLRGTKRRKSQKCTFRKSGPPVRRTERRESQRMRCQNF